MPNTTFLLGNKLIDSSKFLKTQQISLKKRPLEGGEKECHFLSCRTVAALSLLTSNRHMNKISFKYIQLVFKVRKGANKNFKHSFVGVKYRICWKDLEVSTSAF